MSGISSPENLRRAPESTHDAVMIIPGIMGSELVDTASGDVLWGLHPVPYVTAWLTGSTLARMRLSDSERAGRYGAVKATRLLRSPAWLPILQGVEPYKRLTDAVQTVTADPAAVREFPYDWRLPVAYNAMLLAEAAMNHIEFWRRQPAHENARRHHPTGRPAKLVLVAHSMGGLLAQHLTQMPGVAEHIRATITLGTPFHGAVKAALMINSGRGTTPPLPSTRPLTSLMRGEKADGGVRALARTLPGIYDLLPSYACVNDGNASTALSLSDIEAIGGDPELAQAAQKDRKLRAGSPLIGHELVIGKAQRTMQSMSIENGVVRALEFELRDGPSGIREVDRRGDGTVPTSSAEITGLRPWRLAQQHGALARAGDAIAYTLDMIKELEPELLGPPLSAETGIGLQLPHASVPVNTSWAAVITGLSSASQGSCTVHDAGTGAQVSRPKIQYRDEMQAEIELPAPGLYRVTVAGSGESATSQLILATPA